jgi:hypothetical protein
MTETETQTDNSECIYVLSVFHSFTSYSENLCLFTDYQRALNEQKKLQEKIDAYQKTKDMFQKYKTPIVDVTKVKYCDFDKVHPEYADIVEKYEIKQPLMSIPSSGQGCWYEFLQNKTKDYEKRIGTLIEDVNDDITNNKKTKALQTRFQEMYIVTDFYGLKDISQSKIIGIFTNPRIAHEVQTKVLDSYAMDVYFTTYNEDHLVELQGFTNNDVIDPEVVYYRRIPKDFQN